MIINCSCHTQRYYIMLVTGRSGAGERVARGEPEALQALRLTCCPVPPKSALDPVEDPGKGESEKSFSSAKLIPFSMRPSKSAFSPRTSKSRDSAPSISRKSSCVKRHSSGSSRTYAHARGSLRQSRVALLYMAWGHLCISRSQEQWNSTREVPASCFHVDLSQVSFQCCHRLLQSIAGHRFILCSRVFNFGEFPYALCLTICASSSASARACPSAAFSLSSRPIFPIL